MLICACGCGQEIPPRPHHRFRTPTYITGHGNRGRPSPKKGIVTTSGHVPSGTLCGCGCGTPIPERHPSGTLRKVHAKDGKFYVQGHQPFPKGAENRSWKGGRYVNNKGYVLVRAPEHPHAGTKGYVFEHRLVMERKLGRLLRREEIVHHINGDRADNAETNLELVENQSAHIRQHGTNPNAMSTREHRSAAGKKGAAARWAKVRATNHS